MYSKALFFLLASFALVNGQTDNICAGDEFACVQKNEEPGIQITLYKEDGTCKTKCRSAEKAKRKVARGKASCGTVCAPPTTIADACENTEVCSDDGKSFLVKYTKTKNGNERCVQRCKSASKASKAMLKKEATCGACPLSEAAQAASECAADSTCPEDAPIRIQVAKENGRCKSKCVSANRAARAFEKKGATCGACPLSEGAEAAAECADSTCPADQPFRIQFTKTKKNGKEKCTSKCVSQKRATRAFRNNNGNVDCGECPE